MIPAASTETPSPWSITITGSATSTTVELGGFGVLSGPWDFPRRTRVVFAEPDANDDPLEALAETPEERRRMRRAGAQWRAWWDVRRAQLDRSDQLRRLARPRGERVAAPTVGVLDGRLRRHAARVRCSR